MQPETNQEFQLTDLLACVNREVAMRKSCYPKWDKVTSLNQLTPSRKRELAMMTALGAYLEKQAATPAPASNEMLSELEALEQQATPAPWTAWIGSGKIFYGEAETNKPGSYSPANLQLFAAEEYDREDVDTELEGFNIQPGTAEDDAAFIAALRNAAPALLARVRQAEAKVKELQVASDTLAYYTLDGLTDAVSRGLRVSSVGAQDAAKKVLLINGTMAGAGVVQALDGKEQANA